MSRNRPRVAEDEASNEKAARALQMSARFERLRDRDCNSTLFFAAKPPGQGKHSTPEDFVKSP
jgi:hypothetical protein